MCRPYHLVLLLLIFVCGCSFYRIDSQDTTLDYYAPKSSASQVAYLDKIDRAHEVIGIVSVTAERTCPFNDIVDKMKLEAAVLGGDAITDVHPSNIVTDNGGGGVNLFKKATIRLQYLAKVVVLK